ncbi:hypothetical protein [Nocardioides marmorisolisilvae]|uniref:Uncharacterized protein n=1 Tax=Nocardioides marmorisolisilvae TaxID=1542737 RepID=A0A3N0DVQ2_9ACTN|nr:hypothetical protein [Nocardioides marmorisolisilvae]RNL79689.1 hypothetical protein EFL95_12055 [Nocardioides marmorisolisilvae]
MFIPLEEAHGGGFLHEYWSILTDPAHVSVELTLTLLFDGLLLGVLWPLIRAYFNHVLERQHAALDEEHGIVHHGDHVHHVTEPEVPASAAECEDT